MFANNSPIDSKTAAQLSPLSLAYLGDAVYELIVRQMLISGPNRPNGMLHASATDYVSARAQSAFVDNIIGELTGDELHIYKRGRNSDAVPGRNVAVSDYKKATGLEALFGYLYLIGANDRLWELFCKMSGNLDAETE